jgi:hypothetical protein
MIVLMNNLFKKYNFYKSIFIFVIGLILILLIYNFYYILIAIPLLLTLFFDDSYEYALLTDIPEESFIKPCFYKSPEIPSIFEAGKYLTAEEIQKKGDLKENLKQDLEQQDARHANHKPLYLYYESDKKDLYHFLQQYSESVKISKGE